MAQTYDLIDLFCGAGGFTEGFVRTGRFRSVLANDADADAVATYSSNFGGAERHAHVGRLEELLADPDFEVPPADVVIGGPPCQGFSLLNKGRRGDARRDLWRPYFDVVQRSGARLFVMENVQQLLSSYELVDLVEEAAEHGFEVRSRKLCAADFGVPQERYRAIVLGSRVGAVDHPEPTHGEGRVPWVTVRDAIGDLPEPVGTAIREVPGPLNLHFGRNPTAKSRERYRAVPPGGNRFDLQRNRPDITPDCWIRKTKGGTDLFGRLWWSRPSVTIRTEFFKPEKGRYLHPEAHRPITHREAARLQGFPDAFRFCGSKSRIARQIGNAVPPPLAEAIGSRVAEALDASGVSVGEGRGRRASSDISGRGACPA